MPKLLLAPNQAGWPLYGALLVALLRFLEPYLRCGFLVVHAQICCDEPAANQLPGLCCELPLFMMLHFLEAYLGRAHLAAAAAQICREAISNLRWRAAQPVRHRFDPFNPFYTPFLPPQARRHHGRSARAVQGLPAPAAGAAARLPRVPVRAPPPAVRRDPAGMRPGAQLAPRDALRGAYRRYKTGDTKPALRGAYRPNASRAAPISRV